MAREDSKKNLNPNGSSSPDSTELTQVDLGEDLLSPEVVVPRKAGDGFAAHSSEDQYESARILINEGFTEDAKKLLRKILIEDPTHSAAKKSLQEILDREMKDLLADRDPPIQRPRLFERKGKKARTPQSTSDEVVRQLDQEFGLGVTEASAGNLEADVRDTNGDDRVDLGVAFMEMGLHDEAINHFRAALDQFENSEKPDRLRWISTLSLIGHAHLLADRAFEVTQILHPALRDQEIPAAEKIEFFYLMGLALEKLGNRKGALPWFSKVREIDPHYRDIRERLRKPIE